MAEVILFPGLASIVAHEVKPGLENVAEAGKADAEAHVPVLTGALQSSLGVAETDDGWQITVGTNYWPFVEFGTIYMSAQPFMRPIIDNLGLSH